MKTLLCCLHCRQIMRFVLDDVPFRACPLLAYTQERQPIEIARAQHYVRLVRKPVFDMD